MYLTSAGLPLLRSIYYSAQIYTDITGLCLEEYRDTFENLPLYGDKTFSEDDVTMKRSRRFEACRALYSKTV